MEFIVLWFITYFVCGGFVFFLWRGVKEGFEPKEEKEKESVRRVRVMETEATVEEKMQKLGQDFMRKKMAVQSSCLADDGKEIVEEELDSWYMFEVAQIIGVTPERSEQVDSGKP